MSKRAAKYCCRKQLTTFDDERRYLEKTIYVYVKEDLELIGIDKNGKVCIILPTDKLICWGCSRSFSQSVVIDEYKKEKLIKSLAGVE